MNNPQKQTIEEIVLNLQTNDKRQYTESAHAEIYKRLIDTIKDFNNKAEKTEKIMLVLALAQVVLACAQIFTALK